MAGKGGAGGRGAPLARIVLQARQAVGRQAWMAPHQTWPVQPYLETFGDGIAENSVVDRLNLHLPTESCIWMRMLEQSILAYGDGANVDQFLFPRGIQFLEKRSFSLKVCVSVGRRQMRLTNAYSLQHTE